MPKKLASRIGFGKPAVVIEEVQKHFSGLHVIYRGDDIHQPTDWRIHDDQHSIVVHLGGHMDRLETELDGFGGSTGAALPGEIWTVPAERRYASHACGKSIEYAVLRLAPNAWDLINETRQGRLDINPVAGVRDDFLHYATRQLIRAMRAGDDVSTMFAESLSETVNIHLLRSLSPGGPVSGIGTASGPVLSQSTARKLRDQIEQRLDERLTLAELARIADLTTHQFLIAFRKVFGSTPGQYIIRQRLRRAQRLLLNTRKDITSIALECGFSSHSHLTASFSRIVGCAPKVFRETARRFQIPLWRK